MAAVASSPSPTPRDLYHPDLAKVLQSIAGTPEVLDQPGVAKFLRAAERSVIRWRKCEKNPLPAHKAGGGRRILFLRDEVIRWLASHRDNPSSTTPRAIRRRPSSGNER